MMEVSGALSKTNIRSHKRNKYPRSASRCESLRMSLNKTNTSCFSFPCDANATSIFVICYKLLIPVECSAGVVFNVLSFFLYRRIAARIPHTTYNLFVLLAANDVAYLLVILPISIIRCPIYNLRGTLRRVSKFYEVYVYYPINSFLFKISLFINALVALDRLLMISKPTTYPAKSRRLARKLPRIYLIAFLVLFLLNIYRFFVFKITGPPCFKTEYISDYPIGLKLLAHLLGLLIYILPTAIIVVCNFLIVRFLLNWSWRHVDCPNPQIHRLTFMSVCVGVLTLLTTWPEWMSIVGGWWVAKKVTNLDHDSVIAISNCIELTRPMLDLAIWMLCDSHLRKEAGRCLSSASVHPVQRTA